MKRIKKIFNRIFGLKYNLNENEKILWNSILEKAKYSKKEWPFPSNQYYCTPWINNINNEESQLLDKIHDMFYGKNYFIVDPVSGKQAHFIWFDDIKNKVET